MLKVKWNRHFREWYVFSGSERVTINYTRTWKNKEDLSNDLRVLGLKLGKCNAVVRIDD